MDGVSLITQCPVISHTHFVYEFDAADAGTHFWHAHAGTQRADGIFGPLIVREYDTHDPHADLYDHDLADHVIMVNDWINETSISKFSGHYHNDGDNKPTSMLINGRGAPQQTFSSARNETPRATFRVQHGNRYRFRLINAGFLYCPVEFSIDNHTLTVIASDGGLVEPVEVASLIIYAGERYDFVVDANQTSATSYWIRVKGWADCGVHSVFQTAILSYADKAVSALEVPLPGDPSLLNYDHMNRTDGLVILRLFLVLIFLISCRRHFFLYLMKSNSTLGTSL